MKLPGKEGDCYYMKRHIPALVLTALLCAICAAGCGTSKESSGTEPVTKPVATIDKAATEAPTTVAETTAKATEATKATEKSSRSKARVSNVRKNSAQTATQSPTAPTNIPPDTITGSNINPNINSIAGRISSEIKANQVKSISLSKSDLELEVGESAELEVTYNPSGAMYKLCTAKVNNNSVQVSSSNTKVSVKAKTAGTCVLTVTSYNGHKATCNITVKRNETITDDTKLDHKELCTAQNVQRWTTEITSECQKLGMTQSSSLKGADIAIDTSENKGKKQSYNEVRNEYVQSVKTQLGVLVTGGSYKDYVFNCYSESKGGGEYYINIVVSEKTQ